MHNGRFSPRARAVFLVVCVGVAAAAVAGPARASQVGNFSYGQLQSATVGAVNVATPTDNATTFSQTPVQAGLPIDDREWVAAFGAGTSLLTYHDIATNDIDVLRSDNSGLLYTQIAQVIPQTDYKAQSNE